MSNTWKWASDYYGLVVLVSIPNDERSLNPLSKDFFWVSQNIALTLLTEFDYPYTSCSSLSRKLLDCSTSKIEYAGRSIGIVDAKTELIIYKLIQHLIAREEPINEYSMDGYTAFQSAILGNSPKLVSLLLDAGADPYLPIKREGKMKGKNSIEFIEFLSSNNSKGFEELKKVFYKKIPNKKLNLDSVADAPPPVI